MATTAPFRPLSSSPQEPAAYGQWSDKDCFPSVWIVGTADHSKHLAQIVNPQQHIIVSGFNLRFPIHF